MEETCISAVLATIIINNPTTSNGDCESESGTGEVECCGLYQRSPLWETPTELIPETLPQDGDSDPWISADWPEQADCDHTEAVWNVSGIEKLTL